jgi:hypothetical protein
MSGPAKSTTSTSRACCRRFGPEREAVVRAAQQRSHNAGTSALRRRDEGDNRVQSATPAGCPLAFTPDDFCPKLRHPFEAKDPPLRFRSFFILLHVTALLVGTAALWWFVLPDQPAEALADGISAGAIAGYAEIMAIRLRL